MELIIRDSVINGTVYGTNILYGAEGDDEKLIIPNHVETICEQAFGYNEVNPNIKERYLNRADMWKSVVLHSHIQIWKGLIFQIALN